MPYPDFHRPFDSFSAPTEPERIVATKKFGDLFDECFLSGIAGMKMLQIGSARVARVSNDVEYNGVEYGVHCEEWVVPDLPQSFPEISINIPRRRIVCRSDPTNGDQPVQWSYDLNSDEMVRRRDLCTNVGNSTIIDSIKVLQDLITDTITRLRDGVSQSSIDVIDHFLEESGIVQDGILFSIQNTKSNEELEVAMGVNNLPVSAKEIRDLAIFLGKPDLF